MKSLLFSRILSSLSSLWQLSKNKHQQQHPSLFHHHDRRNKARHYNRYVIMKLLFTIILVVSFISLLWNNTSRIGNMIMITTNSNNRIITTSSTSTTMDIQHQPQHNNKYDNTNNNNANNNNNHNNNKPHFVLHVGPPKTATTTIQEILMDYDGDDTNNILYDKSRYIYLGKEPDLDQDNPIDSKRGRFMNRGNINSRGSSNSRLRRNKKSYDKDSNNNRDDNNKPFLSARTKRIIQNKVRDIECHEQMSQVREIYYYNKYINKYINNTNHMNTTLSLYDSLIQLSCATNIINILQPYSIQNINFIFSDEGMSRSGPVVYRKWNQYDTYYSKYDYISLSILLQPIYQLTIIVTYRRYYEWYISAKQEQERYKKHRYHWNVWPSKISDSNNSTDTIVNSNTLLNNQQQTQDSTSTTTTEETKDDDNEVNDHDNDDTITNNDDNDEKGNASTTHIRGLISNNNNNNETATNSITDTSGILYYRNIKLLSGLIMEPLFPNYYHTIIPGIVQHHNNPFDFFPDHDNETAIINHEQKYSLALSKSLYWANTIGIPYHYTYTMMNDLYQQQDKLLSKYSNNNNNNNLNSNNNDNLHNNNVHNPLNVVIFNLHALSSHNKYSKPIVRTNFFCNALPNSENLCQYSKELDNKSNNKEKHSNPSVDYSIYDILITTAYQKYNLLSIQMINRGRNRIVREAQQYHKQLLYNEIKLNNNNNSSKYDIIYKCPYDTTDDDNDNNNDDTTTTNNQKLYHLNKFLNQSLYYEELIVFEYYNDNIIQKGKERHINDYWYNVYNTTKFCTINADSTLKQLHWIQFFYSNK